MNEVTASNTHQKLFLTNLRQTTAQSHKQLEKNSYSKAITEPAVTLIAYQTYIAKLYGVVQSCELDVFPAITSILPDSAERYKAGLIRDDLIKTGISLSETEKLAYLSIFFFKYSPGNRDYVCTGRINIGRKIFIQSY